MDRCHKEADCDLQSVICRHSNSQLCSNMKPLRKVVSFLWLGVELGQLEHSCCWGSVLPVKTWSIGRLSFSGWAWPRDLSCQTNVDGSSN